MTFLIHAKDLNVSRQDKMILKDISLSIHDNDFITIIGPNGAGKSMLLKCLMGFYQPNAGTITKKEGLRIGYMPQRITAEQTLPITVKRFLRLGKKTNEETVREVCEETQIEHLLEKMLFILSSGEMQRVLLARSLLDHPELLVLDEPAQNLDISGQLSFYKLLSRIYEQRPLSILMVSHDLHMVMASTKQVICLYQHICCSGEPHMVTKDPEFISLFGHDMANMMAVYQHSHNHTHEC
ncbi:MAG: ATP-binding cassette domain-containing protein [Pseudomonadota bacterium]